MDHSTGTASRLHVGRAGVSRRAVVGSAVWAAPTIVVASAVPAFAMSTPGGPVVAFTSDFNSIAGGLPTGVTVRTGASNTVFPGAVAAFTTTQTLWTSTTGAFSNIASATGLPATASSAMQNAATNRAMGLRQSGSFGDPGAAFVVNIGPTVGRTDIVVSVRAQQVAGPGPGRTTSWVFDGGTDTTRLGAAAGGFTTVLGAFQDEVVTASFGTLLDNVASDVLIRIATVAPSTGSGSRPFTAIDELTVTYTPV